MIIDTEPPDRKKRRWPFLVVWSLAAGVIVLALFLTHAPASLAKPVAVSASQDPLPTQPASFTPQVGSSRITQQYTAVTRLPTLSHITYTIPLTGVGRTTAY
jgi:hypothetical protein